MIFGIELPREAKVEQDEYGKLFIIFDENITKRDLWNVHLDMWLTEGNSKEEFHGSHCHCYKVLEVTRKNKLRFRG